MTKEEIAKLGFESNTPDFMQQFLTEVFFNDSKDFTFIVGFTNKNFVSRFFFLFFLYTQCLDKKTCIKIFVFLWLKLFPNIAISQYDFFELRICEI